MASYLSCIVAGAELHCFAKKAVYWPTQETLIVADLHWGKAETFQQAGIPVPSLGIDEDLQRLGNLCRETRAQRLILLGDVIHSRRGISEQVSQKVRTWRASIAAEVLWIEGNHDRASRGMPEEWNMQAIRGDHVEGDFRFAHEPSLCPVGRYTLAGHLHPVVRLGSRLDRVRLPCFWFEQRVGVLPSFGSFTGGAEVSPGRKSQVLVVAEEQVLRLPESPRSAFTLGI